jgi:flagellar biosynthesis protein FliR
MLFNFISKGTFSFNYNFFKFLMKTSIWSLEKKFEFFKPLIFVILTKNLKSI